MQWIAAPPNKALINVFSMPAGQRISTLPDVLVKLSSMSPDTGQDEQESLRARSEHAIGDLAQALFDSQMLENALAAAFGAREKALEAQHAALSALNLPSAGDVERLERRLRSFSQRMEDVEEQVDHVSRELGEIRRQIAAAAKKQAKSNS
jgi:chromosome segregation ATPase